MKKEWTYHKPVFECDRINKILYQYAPWSGLRSFAYDYILAMRPKTIVELGSHYGCSSFAFLQAIKDGEIPASFFAIDTWAGDAYTQNDYQENVIGAYKSVQDTLFEGIDAHMMRMTFDKAVEEFEDHSIDLLHIDGSHMYEDVKHDYLTWLPKVKSDGVIFFHDIGKDLFKGEYMGSHVFWRELGEVSPYSRIEIPFSCGLGLLFLSQKVYRKMIEMIDIDHYQEEINIQDSGNKAAVREYYFKIKSQKEYIDDLEKQKEVLRNHLEHYKTDEQKKDEYIEDLKRQKEVLQNHLEQYKTNEQKKDEYIEDLKRQKEVLKTHVEHYKTDEQKKDEYIEDLKRQKDILAVHLESYKTNEQKKDEYIEDLKKQKEVLEAHIGRYKIDDHDKDIYIKELQSQKRILQAHLKSYEIDGQKKAEYITELEKGNKTLVNDLLQKDNYISELEQNVHKLNDYADQKQFYVERLEAESTELNQFITGKEKYIKELEEDKKVLEEFAHSKDEYAASLEKQMKEYIKKQKDLLIQIETSVQEIQYLRGTIEDKDNKIWSLSEEVQKMRRRIDQDEQEILEHLKKIDNLKHLIEEEEKMIMKLPFGDRILQRIKKDAI